MKREIIKFRCTLFEKKLLKVRAKKAGISLSEFCRRAAFQDQIVERMDEQHIEIYTTLIKYHVNFKRIANMFRKRNPKLADEVVSLTDEIKAHLNTFKK
jgi:uncharacterized coiled-coil protein SlyX